MGPRPASATGRVRMRYASPRDTRSGSQDLVELETLDVRLIPGVVLKHYTARDLVSRWDVLGVYTRATATTASAFLDQLLQRMPFTVRAIQVDSRSLRASLVKSLAIRTNVGTIYSLPYTTPTYGSAQI